MLFTQSLLAIITNQIPLNIVKIISNSYFRYFNEFILKIFVLIVDIYFYLIPTIKS